MRERYESEPVPVVTEHRRLVVTVEGRGELTFRLPSMGISSTLSQWYNGEVLEMNKPAIPAVLDPKTGEVMTAEVPAVPAIFEKLTPYQRIGGLGFAIGVCWADEWQSLETEVPPGFPTDAEEARRIGNAIIDEMQDAGWSIPEVRQVTRALSGAIGGQFVAREAAKALAGNGEPSPGVSTSTMQTSGSTSTETREGSTNSAPMSESA